MPLSYTFDLTTDVGQVRSELGDAPDDVPADLSGTARSTWKCLLADEEIQRALTLRDNDLWEACADLCERLAGQTAGSAAMLRVGDYQIDTRATPAAWQARAAAFRERGQSTPAEAIVTPNNTIFQVRSKIGRALIDNAPTEFWE